MNEYRIIEIMRVILTGGGTGGHIFPALAIAEELTERGNEILFVGASHGLETKIIPAKGYNFEVLNMGGLKGKRKWEFIKNFLKILPGLYHSYGIIKRFQPHLVIGFGGYVSGPLVLIASLMGIKTAIQEQNFFPGITNRLLFPFVDLILLPFGVDLNLFPKTKTYITGNPVRKSLIPHLTPQKEFSKESMEYEVRFTKCEVNRQSSIVNRKFSEGRPFTILVVGGSQGAHALNLAMLECIDFLQYLKDNLFFIHQCGWRDLDWVAEGYRQKGLMAQVEAFIEEMAQIYSQADLVICRAGALTISELALQRKASIIIPYPFSANNHQELNARALASQGAAEVILQRNLNGRILADSIKRFYQNPEEMKEMEEKIGAWATPEASKRIVDLCYQLYNGWNQSVRVAYEVIK